MLYVFFLSLFVYLNKRLIYLPVSWFKVNLRHGQLVPVNLFAVNCARLIVVESSSEMVSKQMKVRWPKLPLANGEMT